MKIRINHDDLKLGASGRQSIKNDPSSGFEVERKYLDAHNGEILVIKRDSKGLVVEIDSRFAIVEEQENNDGK